MNDLPITIRPAVPEDIGFILSTWSREYHKTYPFNFIPNAIYVPHQTKLIHAIISTTPVNVACIEDDPNTIVGFICGVPHDQRNVILHYAVVKGIFRRLGVFQQMLSTLDHKDKNIICTHMFNLFKTLKNKYSFIYDPTLLEEYNGK
jgi:hypothetical protein